MESFCFWSAGRHRSTWPDRHTCSPAPTVQTDRSWATLQRRPTCLQVFAFETALASFLLRGGPRELRGENRTVRLCSCSSSTVTGGNIHTGLPGLYHIYNHIHTVPPGSYYNCIYIAADAWLSHSAGAWLRWYRWGWERRESPGRRRTACCLLCWGAGWWSWRLRWLKSFWSSSPSRLNTNTRTGGERLGLRAWIMNFFSDYSEREEDSIKYIMTNKSHYKLVEGTKSGKALEYANQARLGCLKWGCRNMTSTTYCRYYLYMHRSQSCFISHDLKEFIFPNLKELFNET